MNPDALHQRLRETAWRRTLTDAETAELRAWLATHPEARADWVSDEGLSRALRELPDVPVASNFTARVVGAVERDATEGGIAREPAWRHWWRSLGWAPKAAIAAAALCVGLFSAHLYRAETRQQLARSVAVFSEVNDLPSPEVLQDYEAIRRLDPSPLPDNELIALLQ